jgi:hypothetical protein
MTSALDSFRRLSFDGIEFPYKRLRVQGSMRHHVHEYPHTPGGAPEKQGRALYKASVSATFHASFLDTKWSHLYPTTLNRLCKLFDSGETKDLHLPNLGTVKAFATNWDRDLDTRIRSGEEVQIEFLEDKSEEFLVAYQLQMESGALEDRIGTWTQYAEETVPAPPSIFDSITNLANSVLAYRDQTHLYDEFLESKIASLLRLINQADSSVRELNDPLNWRTRDALADLWNTISKLHKDPVDRGVELRDWTIPRLMSLSEVAAALYGDATKSEELIGLNVLDDPYAIPANTVIRYYDTA